MLFKTVILFFMSDTGLLAYNPALPKHFRPSNFAWLPAHPFLWQFSHQNHLKHALPTSLGTQPM